MTCIIKGRDQNATSIHVIALLRRHIKGMMEPVTTAATEVLKCS
jgi:hypothetical protein